LAVALIDLANALSPMAGDIFDLTIPDHIMGAFSSVNFASLTGGLFFSTNLIIDEFGDDFFQLVVIQGATGEASQAPAQSSFWYSGWLSLASCVSVQTKSCASAQRQKNYSN
jgi:hypothetical protein